MARCILHIGTHKTGTTAIQQSFLAGGPWLDEAGLYYPQAGRVYGGHHNAAFDLVGSPLFERERGTLADLLDEVAREDGRRSVVSSEVLHFAAAVPAAMERLRAMVAERRIEARVVLYLRDPASYAASLYGQLRKRGLVDMPFAAFVETIAREGAFSLDGWRRYPFAYREIVDPFAAAFGADAVIVRRYERGAGDDALLRDFLEAAGARAASDLPAARHNVSPESYAALEDEARRTFAGRLG